MDKPLVTFIANVPRARLGKTPNADEQPHRQQYVLDRLEQILKSPMSLRWQNDLKFMRKRAKANNAFTPDDMRLVLGWGKYSRMPKSYDDTRE